MKHFDTFTRYGGFTIAAQKKGWETIGHSEIDKYANAVLEYNFNIKNYGSVCDIDFKQFRGEVDIITGGTPCQDLSVAGKGKGLEGERSGLFFEFIRALTESEPTYFVWENVKGALSSSKGWDFARVQIEMEQAGYDVWWQVINAKDFGVPQNRERIFAIGIRKGSGREILFEQRESGENTDKVELEMVGMAEVTVKKRKYNTPVEINEYLREHKVGTIGQIAEKLELPKTQVEHYFRTDSSRAIPSPDVWLKLKEMLGLDDTYDKQVTDFYEKEMEFESTRRIYDSKGVAKTTDTSGTGLYAIPNSNGNIHSLDANYWKGSNNPNKSRRSQIAVYDDYNSKLREDGNIGSITTNIGNQAPRNGTKLMVREATKKGYAVAEEGDSINLSVPNSKTRRGRVGKGVAQTLDTASNQATIQDMRIRRLTPMECERLMGLEDNWTAKGIMEGEEVEISDTQRYKMCGNGVVVNCVDYIYKLVNKEQ